MLVNIKQDIACKVFVFDPKLSEKESRRPWADLIGTFEDVDWDQQRMVFQIQNLPISQGVVLAHRSKIEQHKPDVLEVMQTILKNQPSLTVIVISGSPQTEKGQSNEHYYFRRTPVATRGMDEPFAAGFKNFINGLERGILDFMLLEPNHLPCMIALAILIQGYLVARGRNDLLIPDSANCQDPPPLSANAANTVILPDWWKRPFIGLDLRSEVRKECGDSLPSCIEKLLGKIEAQINFQTVDDNLVASALQEIRSVLKQ